MSHETATTRPTNAAALVPTMRSVIGLRHEAGLAAGHVMELRPGSYAFGPSNNGESGLRPGQPDSQSFRLDVDLNGAVRVVPNGNAIAISGSPVVEPRALEANELLVAGPDAFTLVDLATGRDPGRPGSSAPVRPVKVLPVEVDGPTPSLAAWVVLGLIGAALAILVSWWLSILILIAILGFVLGTMSARRELENEQNRHRDQIAAAETELAEQIGIRARHINSKLRQQHRGPAALLDPTSVDLGRDDRAVLPLGLAAQPWSPEVEDRANAGWNYRPVVDAVDMLNDAPLLVDLTNGPIAITGPRTGALAAARYLTAAMARRFTDDELSLTTPANDDWAWTRSLPRPSAAPNQTAATGPVIDLGVPKRVFVVNDVASGAPTQSITGHGVIIAPDAASLPTGWQIHLQILADGTAAVRTNRGAVLAASMIPHGVTQAAIEETTTPASLGTNIVDADHGGLVLHVADNLSLANDLLGSVAAGVASDFTPGECAIFVIDDGQRHMIRMQQLPHVRRYMGIDDRSIGSLLDEAEQTLRTDVVVVLLVAEIDQAYRYLIATGQSPRAEQLLYLAHRSSDARLIVAASALSSAELPGEVAAAVATRIHRINGQATVVDRWGHRTIQLDEPKTADLTQSVARIRGH